MHALAEYRRWSECQSLRVADGIGERALHVSYNSLSTSEKKINEAIR